MWAGGGGGGEQRSVSGGGCDRAELSASSADPFVLRPRCPLPRRPGRRDPGADRAGRRLRRLRLGQHDRPGLARDHDPTRGAPGAADSGLVSDGRPAAGVRSHAPAGHLRALDACAHRPPAQRRRRRPPVESRLLALQHAPATGNLGAVRPAPRRYRQAGHVRSAQAERRSPSISASSTKRLCPCRRMRPGHRRSQCSRSRTRAPSTERSRPAPRS